MAFCSYCGSELPEEGSFCTVCGKKIQQIGTKPKQQQPVPTAAPEKPAKKKRNWTLIVILICVGVLLLYCGGAIIADLADDGEVDLFGLLDSDSAVDDDDDDKDLDDDDDDKDYDDDDDDKDYDDDDDDDRLYIAMISKGFQHQFWQAVARGAQDAADRYGVDVYFDGPPSEVEIQAQVDMIYKELAKNPDALALAALDTEAVRHILDDCAAKGLPVIGFDSGVPGDTSGAVQATVATSHGMAAAIAADKFGEHKDVVAAMRTATVENPVRIAVLSQDAVSVFATGRTTGFVDKMKQIAAQYGTVAVVGHDKWKSGDASQASIIIEVAISATTEAGDVQNAANTLLAKNDLIALFCSNEGTVTGFLAATNDGEDLADGGKYADLVVAGFDAGAAQKNAVRKGWFYGSVTQDPYHIGYYAVEMAVKAAKGETVTDVDTGAKWYDSTNIDNEDIALLVYN